MNWDQSLLLLANRGLASPFMDGLMLVITTVSMPLIAMMPVLLLKAQRKREGTAFLAVS